MSTAYPDKPVYIIDDETFILQSLSAVLRSDGINNIETISDSRKLIARIMEQQPSLVLLDLTMPHRSGESLLPEIKEIYPDLPVLIITGINELSTAVECMKNGAADYLVKAIENSKLLSAVRTALSIDELKNENRLLKKSLLASDEGIDESFNAIITEDPAMISIFRYLAVISRSKQTVLLRGETGTGKELFAEAVHKASGRSGEFVSINAAGLDDTMFSDTLFGHKKGAYSGADLTRPGLIEKAAGGTLFLDEIGDLSAASQIKLLRLLEKSEYYSLGSDTLKRASCRIIAATNSNLEEKMKDGSFRKDLYFRLASHEIFLPPIRQRRDDIPLLVYHFTKKAAAELGISTPEISSGFIESLYRKELPGNVREIISIINREVGSCGGRMTAAAGEEETAISAEGDSSLLFPEDLPDLKSWSNILVDEALRRAGGNISTAAGFLGISQPALSKRLAKRKLEL
ncbi:MAG: sigma-54-dependent Fis family transcriptional regulator [Spirochaetales bacterium]|nr:sigma-54-dependent Fis family transcriptional regulator [Spirochaetales bacterium]